MTASEDARRASVARLLQGRRLALVGCGKMGGALLDGWLAAGADPQSLVVIEPAPSPGVAEQLAARGVNLTATPDTAAAPVDALVMAVKPQVMEQALPPVTPFIGDATLLVSVAAGLPIAFFKRSAPQAAVLRAMPNTPAAIGQGITALISDQDATPEQRALGEALSAVVGEVVWLEDESQMDAVTAVSGSGPAYVFHVIEALAEAGRAEGLPEALAIRLARATVAGAGALAAASAESAETLRRNVTSPGGTTAAGLEALMDARDGLTPLLTRTVAAAAARSRALAKG